MWSTQDSISTYQLNKFACSVNTPLVNPHIPVSLKQLNLARSQSGHLFAEIISRDCNKKISLLKSFRFYLFMPNHSFCNLVFCQSLFRKSWNCCLIYGYEMGMWLDTICEVSWGICFRKAEFLIIRMRKGKKCLEL